MELKVENMIITSKCKCCLEEKGLKNMWNEHYWMGEREIYGEMLTECFAFEWLQPADIDEAICEPCITRLRDAFNFRKQVLASQQTIHDMTLETVTDEDTPHMPQLVKVEKFETEELPSESEATEYEEIEYLEDEFPSQAKVDEEPHGSQQTSHQNKHPKNKRLSTYKLYTEEAMRDCIEAIRANKMTITEAAKHYNIPRKTVCSKLKDAGRNDSNIESLSSDQSEDTEDSRDAPTSKDRRQKRKSATKLEIAKLRDNVMTVLLYTNATPIHGHWGIGYTCRYCPEQYPTAAELKKHTAKRHEKNDIANLKITFARDFKIDTTYLTCSLCNKRIDALENMMKHLKVVHRKPVHTDIKNQIIPYKFESDELKCALCSKEFTFFKLLAEHMKEHYRNYECPICYRGFINKQTMKSHMPRHETGVYECSFCSKKFDTHLKMRSHERSVHILLHKTHKCGYCDEKFLDSVQKRHHEVNEHGLEPLVFKCQACDKVFGSQRSLRGHTNVVHLNLKPAKCTECDMSFPSRDGLTKHMVKHTGVRKFQCGICYKSYGRKSTLREHMRIHENDRRFKCEFCDQTFVQKCSWKYHMSSKHDL